MSISCNSEELRGLPYFFRFVLGMTELKLLLMKLYEEKLLYRWEGKQQESFDRTKGVLIEEVLSFYFTSSDNGIGAFRRRSKKERSGQYIICLGHYAGQNIIILLRINNVLT